MNAEIIAKLPINSGILPTAARPYGSALSVNHWIVQMWSVVFKGATNVLKHGRLLRRARQVLPSGVWAEDKPDQDRLSRSSGQSRRDANHGPKTARSTHLSRLAKGNSARGGNRCGVAAFFGKRRTEDARSARESCRELNA